MQSSSNQQRRLYYISDTHHERLNQSRSSDINIFASSKKNIRSFLALCGDIGDPFDDKYENFISRHAKRFEHVFILAGNHEYWTKKRTMDEVETQIQSVVSKFNNVTYMYKNQFIIEDTIILGCTLWSPVDKRAAIYSKDFRNIMVADPTAKFGKRMLKFTEIAEIHNNYKTWIEQSLKEIAVQNATYLDHPPGFDPLPTGFSNAMGFSFTKTPTKKVIVLTHHAPSNAMIDTNNYNDDELLPQMYASSCEYMFKPPLIGWISGHTHDCRTIKINGIPSMSNCYGYPGQSTGVSSARYLEF